MTYRRFTNYILFFSLSVLVLNCHNQKNIDEVPIIIAETIELNLSEKWMVLEKGEELERGGYSWIETRLYLDQSLADKFSMTIRVVESNSDSTKKSSSNWFNPDSPIMGLCPNQNERIYCEESEIKMVTQDPQLRHFFQKDWIIPYKNKQIHVKVGAFTKLDFQKGLALSESTVQNLINNSLTNI